MNLAPHEFIIWLLGEIESISELREKIATVNVVEKEVPLLGFVPPLHYIVTDKTGETVVIESDSGELVIKDNPVGVMTNSPEFEWHLKNLNNYLSLQPNSFPNRKLENYEIKPFGQGSGTYGLPGGYTSPERFVRTVYLRSLIETGNAEGASLNAIFKILDNVTIPKGVNIKKDGSIDYTQYRAVFDVSNVTYYFNPYENQAVFELRLDEELLNKKEPVEFDYATGFETVKLK